MMLNLFSHIYFIYGFFGEVSIQILGSFTLSVILLLICRIDIHKGNKSFVKYIHISSQLHDLLFFALIGVFWWTKAVILIKSNGLLFPSLFKHTLFMYYLRSPCLLLKLWWYSILATRSSIVLPFIFWCMLWGMWSFYFMNIQLIQYLLFLKNLITHTLQ